MAYRTRRTTDEVLGDNILALCMLYLSREHGFEGSRLKAMKMLFLPAYEMFRVRAKVLNMRFYRYRLGPYSGEVEQAWNTLGAVGLLKHPSSRGGQFRVTDDGAALAREFYDDVLCSAGNVNVRDCLLEVAQAYGNRSHNDIMHDVYEMSAETVEEPGECRKIGDIPKGRTFTHPLEPTEAVSVLDIPGGWLTTLAIELNPKHRAGLAAAMDDLAAGRVAAVP